MNLAAWLLLLLALQDTEPPLSVSHPNPRFRMTLPRGYRESPSRPPNLAYSYQRIGPDGTGTAITLEVLDGRITREPLSEETARAAAVSKLPPGSQFKLGKAKWGDLELQVMETNLTMSGTDLFTAVVQIPTQPRAVQMAFGGPKAREAEIREDLRQVLRSFRATSDWLTPKQRLFAGITGVSAVAAWLMLAIYGVLYFFLYRGNPLRAWKFRVVFLTAVVVAFATAIAVGPLYEMMRGGSKSDLSFPVLTAVALAVAVNTGRLLQAGREAAKAPVVSP